MIRRKFLTLWAALFSRAAMPVEELSERDFRIPHTLLPWVQLPGTERLEQTYGADGQPDGWILQPSGYRYNLDLSEQLSTAGWAQPEERS